MHIYGEWCKDYTKAFKNLIGTGIYYINKANIMN